MRKVYIFTLTFSALPNSKHIAITDYLRKALREFNIENTVVGSYVSTYFLAYDKENFAYLRIDRQALTKQLNDADTERINALRYLRDSLKLFSYQTDESKKVLADDINKVLDLYGGREIFYQAVDSRTGNITNFVEDLESTFAETIETLGLTAAVQTLKAANEHFLKCQAIRDQSDAEHGKRAVLEARAETDRVWRAIVETINNAIDFGTEEDREVLIPFAKYINVEIDKYRIQTGQGVGGNWGNGSAGGEVVQKKATALFHFADHREETITQDVGTELVAPQNTKDYIWSPAVPATMPAEDTSYVEVYCPKEEDLNTDDDFGFDEDL